MARRGDNIHKRRDGRWEGRYKSGYKENGLAKYSSVYAYSYSECKRKLTEAQSNANRAPRITANNVFFSEVLYAWLYTNKVRIKGSTEAKYKNLIDSHIVPKLGGIMIYKLNTDIINGFLNAKLKEGNLKHGSALSPSYVRTMAIIIEASINYAITKGLCTPLKSPINKPVIPKNNISVLSKKTEAILKNKLLHDPSLTSVGTLLALFCGLRIGEVCALKWNDVDFESNMIHINHTVSRVPCTNTDRKTMLIIASPKTSSSVRSVPLPSSLRSLLLEVFNNSTSEYVISQSNNFVATRTFDYQYRKLLKRYDIGHYNFHTLRHTYATRCAEFGMDAKTLCRLLGHSSPNISLNVYVHPSIDVAKNLVEQIFCKA